MITGGIKFFDENVALYDNGASAVASTGNATVLSILDKLATTKWVSVGSSDAVQETITLLFASATISRLLLLDLNWKNFTVQYWNGSAYVDFTGVSGLDGTKSAVSETAFADDSAYYEFTPVTTTQVQIKIQSTQVANQEKYLATFYAGNELGTLQGYPTVKPALSRNVRTTQMLSGRVKMVKQMQVFSCALNLAHYPVASLGADFDLLASLTDRETPLYMWLCGGRRGTKYFSWPARTWRLRDFYRVQIDSDLSAEWTENIYSLGINTGDLVFTEHV